MKVPRAAASQSRASLAHDIHTHGAGKAVFARVRAPRGGSGVRARVSAQFLLCAARVKRRAPLTLARECGGCTGPRFVFVVGWDLGIRGIVRIIGCEELIRGIYSMRNLASKEIGFIGGITVPVPRFRDHISAAYAKFLLLKIVLRGMHLWRC